MVRLLERLDLQTGSDHSRISLETQGGGAWAVWDRYLAVDGKRAYHLGNICSTCAFLFQRLEGANTSVEVANTAEALRNGVSDLSNRVVKQIGEGLPKDDYVVCLAEHELSLVRPGEEDDFYRKEQIALYGIDSFWDLPHDPRVPYYRTGGRNLGGHAALFQFVVPMFPERWLKQDVIKDYERRFALEQHPTAVALSLLDVKGPADWNEGASDIAEHWTLTHFLLDGHHKAAAARTVGTPLRLLSFIATTKGVSDRSELEIALQALMNTK